MNDNRKWIKSSCIMLPTNEKASIMINTKDNRLESTPNYHNALLFNKHLKITQYLYFLSDEDIKEGDWGLNPKDPTGYIVSCYKGNKESIQEHWKKIIVSTDKSLNLPFPSRQFIDVYIEEYNKGNQINEVMVEWEDKTEWSYALSERTLSSCIKVNPKDNTVTIKKIKDSWNRDEVIALMRKSYNEGVFDTGSIESIIKTNL